MMHISEEVYSFIYKNFDIDYSFIVGSKVVDTFFERVRPPEKESDYDIIITNMTSKELMEKVNEMLVRKDLIFYSDAYKNKTSRNTSNEIDPNRLYFRTSYKLMISGTKNTIDIWDDNIYKYLNEVPIPMMRVAYNIGGRFTIVGEGFPNTIKSGKIELDEKEPVGRYANRELLAKKIISYQKKYGLELGDNAKIFCDKNFFGVPF